MQISPSKLTSEGIQKVIDMTIAVAKGFPSDFVAVDAKGTEWHPRADMFAAAERLLDLRDAVDSAGSGHASRKEV